MDLRVLIDLGTETDNMAYAGIAKILKAYTYSLIVDLWGDVPYFEAATPGIIHPVFDDDQAIYQDLFSLLDEGIDDLQNTESENPVLPGEDDLIYGGDLDKWIRAANTIKLKLFNQVRLTGLYNQAAVDALLAGDLMEDDGNFLLPSGVSSAPDNRNPVFVAEYGGAQLSVYLSPWMYEIMMGRNPRILNGIRDPRTVYYWTNQVPVDGETENPPEYRDGSFVSIYFGSEGINADHAGRGTFTILGIYPCGGKFDDSTYIGGRGGTPLRASTGTGAAPQRMLTYADRLFIEAELIHTGHASGDLKVKLEDAVKASFALVDLVVEMTAPPQNVPVLSGSEAEENYVSAVLNEFDAADNAKKLEVIMTQKWLSSFGWSVDQYTDYRRTGYPVLFDPNSNGGFQNGGPDGSGPVPTQVTRGYPLSFPYDNDELTLNNNAPEQKTVTQARVFWDVD
jgi:hypothetical protein